jgi:hypothetical protein
VSETNHGLWARTRQWYTCHRSSSSLLDRGAAPKGEKMQDFRRAGALLRVTFIAGLMTAFGLGCGGGSATTSDAGTAGNGGHDSGSAGRAGTTGGTAVQQCKELLSVYCDRTLNECAGAAAGANDTTACQASFDVIVGCERAPVTADFTACLADLHAESCDLLDADQSPPSSCNKPVNLIPFSDAQLKCGDLADAFCTKTFECAGVTPTATQMSNCSAQNFSDLQCAFVTEVVQAKLDQCTAALTALSCTQDQDAGVDGGGSSTLDVCGDAFAFLP